jgi:uroporphyrin-III C-methyltransferase/precorrin-2 dehydrogenase/sirohydrochlorin ferrochelatase
MDELNHTYPIFLNLRGKSCLVVGGGRVAERRSRRLLECGALVTIVSPKATRLIRRLHANRELNYVARQYRQGDLEGNTLVILATDDEAVHEQVFDERRREGLSVLINDAMRSERGDFTTPALFREGHLSVAVATGGLMPTLASAVAAEVGHLFGPTAAKILRRYRSWKDSVMSRRAAGLEASRAFRRAVDRRLLEAFRTGDISRIADVLDRAEKLSFIGPHHARGSASPSTTPGAGGGGCGTVYLVGAGPGDPGLITVKGMEVLRRADAVVYDRLIDAEVLGMAPSWSAFHPVGKAPGRHALKQEEINELLKELAWKHETVVRLKGGDPFVFGRGGEEMDSLREEGIPCEVVSGVTSAVAVPANAGIPITHRAYASSFAVVTGHKALFNADEGSMAAPEADTLIYLMGLANLPKIAKALLREGKAPLTPVAVVSMGTTIRQQVVTSSLEAVAEEVRRAGLKPPAVVVVGEVARYAESPDWSQMGAARSFPVDEVDLSDKARAPTRPLPFRVDRAGA